MPIVNVRVHPWVQPPHRGKLVEAGGLRRPEDWGDVMIHMRNSGKHLIVHQLDSFGGVIMEVHNMFSKCGEEELENCTMEYMELDADQRYDLAIYLLSTITPRGK